MKKGVFCFLFILLNVSLVYAIGISPADYKTAFMPNEEQSFFFNVKVDYPKDAELYVSGDFANYTILDTYYLKRGGSFTATINFPDKAIKPGKNFLHIGAKETFAGGQGMSARSAVEALIFIEAPYPGKYIEAEFTVNDVNIGEPVDLLVKIKNLGTQDLNKVKVDIDIYSDKNLITTLHTEPRELKKREEAKFETILNTENLKPGSYKTIAIINYDNEIKTIEKEFRIGTLFVEIINYTKKVFENSINKFDVQVESKWNNQINNIFVEVKIFDNSTVIADFRTPSFELNPWERKILTGYLDTKDMSLGIYNMNLTLFYEDKTTIKSDKIEVIKKSSSFKELFTSTVILIIIIILIVISDLIWILRTKKKK